MPPESKLTLQNAIDDLYQRARRDKATTSTARLRVLAEVCVQELTERGLDKAQIDPEIPGFARAKDWDVAWLHNGKARVAVSLKSLLTNLGGTVPNRIDDLIGEAANLQMYSPETAIGYVVVFNVEEDGLSRKHGCTWSDLFRSRLQSISGRKAPHWTMGTIEAAAFVEVDFTNGPKLVSGGNEVTRMMDILVKLVRERNPDLARREASQ
jgi:hypothetical protein